MRSITFILACLMTITGPLFAQSIQSVTLGHVRSAKLTEASGIASSSTLPGCYWTHNDSGNKPEVFLLDSKARIISTCHLQDVSNRDWEDIAEGIGPAKNKHYVYVGDIGDNKAKRKHIRIYRFEEPAVLPGKSVSVRPDILTLEFPNGPRDAESLMIDPIGKKIYLLSKREKHISLYKTDNLLFRDGDNATLQQLITLPYTWVTAGDISKDGHHIVIKTLTSIYYWHRSNDETVEQAMARPATELPYTPEPQGEGITISTDNQGYITISEGEDAALLFWKHKF
ncbi:hypothetical protein [Chitinophaga solisilvae]|uniref:hypothetical protein n=1 Tax=Chitinophaga solisilvae TaxID=1233460 RepID=UPI00136D0B27|nr:hypothetical protein [Chitinophaga solisilvae]